MTAAATPPMRSRFLGGTASDLTYTAGATHDAGTLTYTGEAGTQTIAVRRFAPITDTVAAATLTINGSAGADAIAVTDGGLVNGFQTARVGAATSKASGSPTRRASRSTAMAAPIPSPSTIRPLPPGYLRSLWSMSAQSHSRAR